MHYFSTKIGKFISENIDNFEKILSDAPYFLTIKKENDYIIFNYNQIDSDFSNDIVKEARGIIFKIGRWEVPVCHSFDKFFNYGESNAASIDWETSVVTQKIDGSIIRVWFDEEWHISTNGMIDAYKAVFSDLEDCNFGCLFEEALKKNNITFDILTQNLSKEFTYIFELVSPKTRVVIPYEKTDVYYLGLRDNFSNTEMPFFSINFSLKLPKKIKTPSCYNLRNVDECLIASQKLPWNEEGYVVYDHNSNMVKIKSPAYVLAHYFRNNNNVSKRRIVDIVNSGEEEEFKIYADDYVMDVEKISKKIKSFKRICFESLKEIKDKKFLSKKEYAEEVKKYPENIHGYLFMNFDRFISVDDYTKNWNSKKWMTYIDKIKD